MSESGGACHLRVTAEPIFLLRRRLERDAEAGKQHGVDDVGLDELVAIPNSDSCFLYSDFVPRLPKRFDSIGTPLRI